MANVRLIAESGANRVLEAVRESSSTRNPAARRKLFLIFFITAVLSELVVPALILLQNVVHEFLALFTLRVEFGTEK